MSSVLSPQSSVLSPQSSVLSPQFNAANGAVKANRAAFSLVELSIVLVILGLLAGGILTGQSLIRAAELRSVTTEFQAFQMAAQTFRNKYFDLPGDMTNATDYWGAAATCPPTSAAPLLTKATCNGNGNGRIELAAVTANESFTIWQHLVNAGLIKGNYTGTADNTSYNADNTIIGENVPKSRAGNVGWYTVFLGNRPIADTFWIEGNYGNALIIGGQDIDGFYDAAPYFTGEEAWNIDKKIDDGLPGSGSLVSSELRFGCFLLADGSAGSRSGSDPRADTQYNLTNTTKNCALVFKEAF